MGQTCSICSHPERAKIDASLIAGEAYRSIAKQFACSEASMYRHKRNCVQAVIQSVKQHRVEQAAQVVEEAEERQPHFVWNALAEMEWLHRQVRLVYDEARAEKDHGSSLKALGEARQQMKLFSELLSGQEEGGRAQLEEEWLNVREAIFEALEPYPEARRAVARALLALGRGEHDTVLPSEQLGETP